MSLLRYHKRNRTFWKITYLGGIVVIVVTVLWLMNFQSTFITTKDIVKKLPVTRSASDKIKNTGLTLQNSVFKGVNKDLEPYEITATIASKVSENQFALDKVGGNYLIGNSNLLINAKNGFLNNLDNQIDLYDDVEIFFNNLLLSSNEIHLNLINKEALSKTQVKATYKNSEIKADSFDSRDNSNIINFKGNVQTILKLGDF